MSPSYAQPSDSIIVNVFCNPISNMEMSVEMTNVTAAGVAGTS